MKNARINRKREGEDQVKLLHKALHNAKHTIGDLRARVGHFIEDEDEVHEAAKEFQEIEQEAASTELRDQLSDEQRRTKDPQLASRLPCSEVYQQPPPAIILQKCSGG